MPDLIDITGQTFSRLTVIARAGCCGHHAAWKCRCTCGSETIVKGTSLRSGHTQSCGCLARVGGRPSHGASGTPTYGTWVAMRSRCENPNHTGFPTYGGRGVSVCERWQKFENFLADMGERPSRDHSIDRIKNDRGYEPGNCRWALPKEQANNRKQNHRYITAFGKTLTLSEWCRETGLKNQTIRVRLRHGWSPEESLTPI